MLKLRVEVITADLPSDEAHVHLLPVETNKGDIIMAVETFYSHLEVIAIHFMMEED